MQEKISLQIPPAEINNDAAIKQRIASATGKKISAITGFHILKKSIDARSKNIRINLTLQTFFDEPFVDRTLTPFQFREVQKAPKKVIIIGAGPAGLFAALQLLEEGIQPIIIERGKDVRARRRDLAQLNRAGIVNPESNYCFGEGGAGTYSDGKLYTRSNKRGDIDRILHLFVHFGAQEKIIYESHPHIGTNQLPHIISAMSAFIRESGGQIHFEQKVTDFILKNGQQISGVTTVDGTEYRADAVILATGHSARDIFELLYHKKILLEPKPFALGVRVEHPQELIDSIQYHCDHRGPLLPPAPYSLVQQVNGRGVFSFCMCPGGIIAPAVTAPGEIVVNGWSPSKRNNPFANSGMVVQVETADVIRTLKLKEAPSPLMFLQFQQQVEQACFIAGGGNLVAPAQRMTDFSNGKLSANLPVTSYHPGNASVQLNTVLPGFVYDALAKAFVQFGKKMNGYFTDQAVVVATESRTSSPVRIPRDPETLVHPQIDQLYPCGEGAGYAGGIVSAAMDGQKVARQISEKFNRK